MISIFPQMAENDSLPSSSWIPWDSNTKKKKCNTTFFFLVIFKKKKKKKSVTQLFFL